MRYCRLPRVDLAKHSYFLTCCLDGRRALFRNPALAELLTRIYAARRDRGDLLLHGYVVMRDHYHVILSLRKKDSVSNLVRTIHSIFARACRERHGVSGRIFQRRFYDHVIRDEKDWLTKLAYVHANPVLAGLA